MKIIIENDVLEYLKSKKINSIRLHKPCTKGSKCCPVMFKIQVELLKRIDSKLDGVKKIVVSNIDVYLDDSIDKNSDYRIFKVLKVPYFPMVIDIEKI